MEHVPTLPPLEYIYVHEKSLCLYPCLASEYLRWDKECEIPNYDWPLEIE